MFKNVLLRNIDGGTWYCHTNWGPVAYSVYQPCLFPTKNGDILRTKNTKQHLFHVLFSCFHGNFGPSEDPDLDDSKRKKRAAGRSGLTVEGGLRSCWGSAVGTEAWSSLRHVRKITSLRVIPTVDIILKHIRHKFWHFFCPSVSRFHQNYPLLLVPSPGSGSSSDHCDLSNQTDLNWFSLCLIQNNFRRPGVSRRLGVSKRPGVSRRLQTPGN